jgi:hypothetical protein
MGDSFLSPIILGWHSGNLHASTGLLIYIPTGDYEIHTLSVGKNTWAFMPQAALTWFDPKSGWDLSGAMTLVFSTKNDATDYQSGDIFHFDWAIGKHFGAWEIGVQGNVMAQFTGDSGSGAKLGSFEASSARHRSSHLLQHHDRQDPFHDGGEMGTRYRRDEHV